MTNGTMREKSDEQAARAVGPQGSELGSAKWVINGRIAITAQSKKSKLK
jgi:hypothetical protein